MFAQYDRIMLELIAGIGTDLSVLLLAVIVYINREKLNDILVRWEDRYIISKFRRIKRRVHLKIASALKANERFMKWLNKPVKHGSPDADWIAGQVRVFGDVWR